MNQTTTLRPLSETELQAAQARSIHNRRHLTGRCGCFHCLSTFMAERVTQWTDDEDTALCPVCGVDAVLSSATDVITADALEQMHARWFGVEQVPEAPT